MKQKLLHKTLRFYLVYSAFILFTSAPVFYYFTRYWYHAEADEALLLRMNEFEKFQLPGFKIADIDQWNHWNRDTKIEAADSGLLQPRFALAKHPNIIENDLEPYRIMRAPITIAGKRFTFFARENLLDSSDMVFNIVSLYVAILLLLLGGLYLLTKRFSSVIWQPFYNMLEELEKFEIDKSDSVQLHDSTTEEFQRLKNVATKLVSRNVSIFRNQKEFIENAAHELQTPLAVMQAKLDNLYQLQNLTGKEADALDSLSNALTRLTRIHKNLFLLSHLDRGRYSEKQAVYIHEILEEQIDFIKEQAALQGIDVEVDIKSKEQIITNAVLAEILCSNLLTNALKHNTQGGKILISLSGKTLVVSNTGLAEPLQTETLFNRFSKMNSTSQGLGLGLSIAKKIAAINHWNLEYAFIDKRHVFSVTF